jgi:hypothetical protein
MPPGCLHPPSGHCLGHQAGCCKSCQSEDHREKETRTAPDRLHKELSGGRGVSATVRSRAARRLFTAVFARKHLDQDRLSTLSRAAFRKLDRLTRLSEKDGLRTVYEFEKLVVGHDIAVAGLNVTQGPLGDRRAHHRDNSQHHESDGNPVSAAACHQGIRHPDSGVFLQRRCTAPTPAIARLALPEASLACIAYKP